MPVHCQGAAVSAVFEGLMKQPVTITSVTGCAVDCSAAVAAHVDKSQHSTPGGLSQAAAILSAIDCVLLCQHMWLSYVTTPFPKTLIGVGRIAVLARNQ